jgi:hypothetical protein
MQTLPLDGLRAAVADRTRTPNRGRLVASHGDRHLTACGSGWSG